MPDSTKSSGELRRRGGSQPLESFEADLGLPEGFSHREGGLDDSSLEKALEWLREDRPRQQNHWPALSLALIAQAEDVLESAGESAIDDVFSTVDRETTGKGKVRNTLNFVYDDVIHTLRPKYNAALNVIRVEMRRDHPSNAAHATQSWDAYRPLIEAIYAMAPAARVRLAEAVWKDGVLEADERRWATQAERIVRPFEVVLTDFPTQGHKPGGALFQALVFGYFRADAPSLTLESNAVNTGSSRADIIGDVAGFRGGEVELAVEVKDYPIVESTVESVLSDFLEDLVNAPNATAAVVADSFDAASRDRLQRSNVIAISRKDLASRVVTWDLPKQQEALRGAIYYLARRQKSTKLRQELEAYLADHGIAANITDQPNEPASQ